MDFGNTYQLYSLLALTVTGQASQPVIPHLQKVRGRKGTTPKLGGLGYAWGIELWLTKGIDGYYSDGGDKAIQCIWVTGLTPVSTPERQIVVCGGEAQVEFLYCNPCLPATVKPTSERQCDVGVAKETAD